MHRYAAIFATFLIVLGGFITEVSAKVFSIKALAAYQSSNVYRGALIWPDSSVIVGPSLAFFNDRLTVAGPSLGYSHFKRDDDFELKAGIRLFDDNEPLIPLSDHEEDYRNQRKNSLEFTVESKYKWGKRKKGFFGVKLGRELIEHKGLYTAFSAGVPVLPFTVVSGDFAFAEKSTAQYLYGPESKSGYAHADLGARVVIPFVPWDGIAMIAYKHSWVLQGENQNADYIRGDAHNQNVAVRLFWNAL